MHQVGLQRAVRALLLFIATIVLTAQVVSVVSSAEAAQPDAMTILALALDLPANTFGGSAIGTSVSAIGFDGAAPLPTREIN
ncbi:MAG: hypothetical protein AAF899_13745 [Pseudomonadota bacterium]